MSDLFDSLKKNKDRKSVGGKRRELSPVKFQFSDEEDSDDVVLKISSKSLKFKGSVNKKQKLHPENQKLLKHMKKCLVKIPLDKNGRKNFRIQGKFAKGRKAKSHSQDSAGFEGRKSKKLIVRLDKNAINSISIIRTKPTKSVPVKTPENKKPIPKVYVKFPLATPNSGKKKKTYAKTPIKARTPKPKGYNIAIKRLNATPSLVREFGKRFFMSYVNIEKCDLKVSPKKKKLNSSVRFNETVEIFGSSSSDEELANPMPVSLVTAAVNGDIDTPKPIKSKGKKSASLKKKPILTPAAKKNYRLSDEKKLTNDIEEDEDDGAEYIIPTEISPLKKQSSPSNHVTTHNSSSPEQLESSMNKDDNLNLVEEQEEPETITDEVLPEKEKTPEKSIAEESIIENAEPIKDSTPEPMDQDPEQEDGLPTSTDPTELLNEEPHKEDPKNNSHNVFEDDDSQGQNIVQDFISRTVQDLSHDDSEDIQDDEELVDEKRSSPPATNDDDDSISSKISRMCQNVKEQIMGVSGINNKAMSVETDKA